MSVSYINAELRRMVFARAQGICEYCLIAEEDTYLGFAIDHILGEKHGGPTTYENLAVACVPCNQAKGSDVGSIHWETGVFTRLFNPRSDRWCDHFRLQSDLLEGITPVGQVTARLLALNTAERRLERHELAAMGRFPNAAAQRLLH